MIIEANGHAVNGQRFRTRTRWGMVETVANDDSAFVLCREFGHGQLVYLTVWELMVSANE